MHPVCRKRFIKFVECCLCIQFTFIDTLVFTLDHEHAGKSYFDISECTISSPKCINLAVVNNLVDKVVEA